MIKKKILFITKNPPYPLTNGGAVAQFFFISKLIDYFDITLIVSVKKESWIHSIIQLQTEIQKLELNIYCDEAQDTIFNNLLNILPYRIKKRIRLKERWITNFFEGKQFLNYLSNHFTLNKYDIIQCEFYETLKLLKFLPQDSLKVFIHHELRFKAIMNADMNLKNIDTLKENEINQLNYADVIGVFNLEDKSLLEPCKRPVIVTPFGIPNQLILKSEVSNEFNKFIFMGGQGHLPNSEGLTRFLDFIYIPLMEKYKMMPLYIFGFWNKLYAQKYSDYKNIKFVGFVEDLTPYYNNAIMLVPIWSGSGIRTKVLQSMANRIPVITTKFGAEGLFTDVEQDHLCFFEDKLSFKEVALTKNDYSEIASKAFRYYENNFGQETLIRKRLELYNLN